MRKLLILAFITIAVASISPQEVKAQTPARPTKDSLLNADTAYSNVPVNGLFETVNIQPSYVKKSGTVSGKIYIDATTDGTNYVILDSLALSDAAPNVFGLNPNSKYFSYTKPGVLRYRVRFVNAGGAGYINTKWLARGKY